MHLRPLKHERDAAEVDPLIAIAGGGGVALHNSTGNPWTADYLKITGELDVDLRSNIAAEARAKIVYERLIQFTDDPGTIQGLQFLMTREITHMKAFTAALESMGKKPFSIVSLPPTSDLVRHILTTLPELATAASRTRAVPGTKGRTWNSSRHRHSRPMLPRNKVLADPMSSITAAQDREF
jgi:Mn-containing catalase